MSLVLIILVVMILVLGAWVVAISGYRGRYYGAGCGGCWVGGVLLIVLLLFGGIGGWRGPW